MYYISKLPNLPSMLPPFLLFTVNSTNRRTCIGEKPCNHHCSVLRYQAPGKNHSSGPCNRPKPKKEKDPFQSTFFFKGYMLVTRSLILMFHLVSLQNPLDHILNHIFQLGFGDRLTPQALKSICSFPWLQSNGGWSSYKWLGGNTLT